MDPNVMFKKSQHRAPTKGFISPGGSQKSHKSHLSTIEEITSIPEPRSPARSLLSESDCESENEETGRYEKKEFTELRPTELPSKVSSEESGPKNLRPTYSAGRLNAIQEMRRKATDYSMASSRGYYANKRSSFVHDAHGHSNSNATNYPEKDTIWFKWFRDTLKKVATWTPFHPRWKQKFKWIIRNNKVQGVLTFLLFVSLFLGEIWVIANTNESADDVLNAFLLIIFLIFFAECILLCMAADQYYGSFFFWTDILGSGSILLDITWIYDDSNYDGATTMLRASRLSKMSKLARVARALKIMRIFRMVQLCYETDDEEPTRVKRLSNEITLSVARRVAMVVLCLLLFLPLLVYVSTDMAPIAEVEAWDALRVLGLCNRTCFDVLIQQFADIYNDQDTSPLEVKIDGVDTWSFWDGAGYVRSDNMVTYDLDTGGYLIMNATTVATTEASYMFGIILIAVVLLLGFSMSFNSRMNQLVINPLDRMIGALQTVTAEILHSVKTLGNVNDEEVEDLEGAMETELLEDVVYKMAELVKRASPHADADTMEKILGTQANTDTTKWLATNFLRGGSVTSFTAHERNPHAVMRASEKVVRRPSSMVSRGSLVQYLMDDGVNYPKYLTSWDFNALDMKDEQLYRMVMLLFTSCEALAALSVSQEVLLAFFQELNKQYVNTIPYHTFRHGVDVCYMLYRLLRESKANEMVTQLDLVIMLVAALAHDAGHLGVNNAFLVTTEHHLALVYNDASPLENMHCTTLFTLMRDQRTALFDGLGAEKKKKARKLCLFVILGTDMAQHFADITKLETFYDNYGEEFNKYRQEKSAPPECMDNEDNKFFVLGIMLHSADISGPLKPPKIFTQWSRLVCEEFFKQGDQEKELNLPVSPMFDRDTTNIPQMQMGFIEFVVSPLIIGITKVFRDLHPVLITMVENYQYFSYQKREEIMKEVFDPEKKNEELNKAYTACTDFENKIKNAIDEATS